MMAEREEEFIANRLMKKLEKLQMEKESLVLQVEQEEELLTNTLQKKLNKLQREKIELQQQLEQEEEFIVNKLQKQLAKVTSEKDELARQLKLGGQSLLNTLHEGVQTVNTLETSLGPEKSLLASEESKKMVRQMSTQLEDMHTAQEAYAQERDGYKKEAEEYKTLLKESDHKNFLLEQKMKLEQEKRNALIQNACMAEQSIEMNTEREVNIVRRHSGAGLSPRSSPRLSPQGAMSPMHSPRHSPRQSPQQILHSPHMMGRSLSAEPKVAKRNLSPKFTPTNHPVSPLMHPASPLVGSPAALVPSYQPLNGGSEDTLTAIDQLAKQAHQQAWRNSPSLSPTRGTGPGPASVLHI